MYTEKWWGGGQISSYPSLFHPQFLYFSSSSGFYGFTFIFWLMEVIYKLAQPLCLSALSEGSSFRSERISVTLTLLYF